MEDFDIHIPTGSVMEGKLITDVRECIAHVKKNNANSYRPLPEATWSPVMSRLGRGRAGLHGWSSRWWSLHNRIPFCDRLEKFGIRVESDPNYKGNRTYLIDTAAADPLQTVK